MGIAGQTFNVASNAMYGQAGIDQSKDNRLKARSNLMGLNLKKARQKLKMTKAAAFPMAPGPVQHSLANTLKYGAILGGVMGGSRALAGLAGKAYDSLRIKRTKNKIMQAHPEWKNDVKANQLFDILADYGPELATNSSVAADFVSRGLRFETTPHEFIREIASIQKDLSVNQYRTGVAKDIHEGFKAGLKIETDED